MHRQGAVKSRTRPYPGENCSVNPWKISWKIPWNFMEFHKYFMGKIRQMFMKNYMKFQGIFHEIFHEIPWNFMKLRLVEFHRIPWKIPWNFMNSWNFMKFGFDRVVSDSLCPD
jgi:hypothetical protein